MGRDNNPPHSEAVVNFSQRTGTLGEIFHPKPTNKYSLQLYRSIIVSVAALFVNLASYYLLKQAAGVHYLVSAPIGYILGIIVNYYLSVKWVFATRKLSKKHHEFAFFVLINLAGLAIYELIIWLSVNSLKLSALLAPIAGNIIVFFWNFLMRKKILY